MSTTSKVSRQTAVLLRDVREADLPLFFEQQLDPQANFMAAFTAEEPADHAAFMSKWARLQADANIVKRTILCDGRVAGHIAKFEMFGETEITYWIGREYWGQGIATRALELFLEVVRERPLFGRAAKDNIASLRVMQKNRFEIIGEGKGFANARGQEWEEYILKLA